MHERVSMVYAFHKHCHNTCFCHFLSSEVLYIQMT